ncbi:MAG TPA: hypothetical protein VK886_15475 [Vicinamibacterales bacterium]|nr:hypothetical protein [Vicinamibacterales bacterium]
MNIDDLGDQRLFSGLEETDARGMIAAPLGATQARAGSELRPSRATLRAADGPPAGGSDAAPARQ